MQLSQPAQLPAHVQLAPPGQPASVVGHGTRHWAVVLKKPQLVPVSQVKLAQLVGPLPAQPASASAKVISRVRIWLHLLTAL